MGTKPKAMILIISAVISIIFAIAAGSVYVPVRDILQIIVNKAFLLPLPSSVPGNIVSIVWTLRIPRVILAFFVGAGLGVSGTVMQSIFQNPLASSYTFGVSSGASLGACLVIFFGTGTLMSHAFFPYGLVPLGGLIGGIGTVILVTTFAARIDRTMSNITIILTGMVFSMFINSIQTLISVLQNDGFQRLMTWQTGSFAMKGWGCLAVIIPVTVVGTVFLTMSGRELDIMTFGEDEARSVGVDVRKKKWAMLWIASILTGVCVAFVGVIGFVDLISPHIVRKIFTSGKKNRTGTGHGVILPMAGIFGGTFMVAADLLARCVLEYSELPVGVVTSLIGAPFFAYIYFRGNAERGR